MNQQINNNLTVYILTDEQVKKSNHGYKYLVYKSYTNHTAFRTLEGFNFWLVNRHLTIDSELKDGESYKINGEYIKISLLHIDPILPDYSNSHDSKNWTAGDFESFGLSSESLTKGYIMDNGDYTTCFIYHGINANISGYKPVTIIYYLNPNCKRTVYNWKEFSDGIPLVENPSIIEK